MQKYLKSRWGFVFGKLLSYEREGLLSVGEFETRMLNSFAH